MRCYIFILNRGQACIAPLFEGSVKVYRATYEDEKGAERRYHVNLYEAETGVVLKEHMVAGKEREWTPGKAFLTPLLLQEGIISADALYTPRNFCQQVVPSRGDYLLFAKGKQLLHPHA